MTRTTPADNLARPPLPASLRGEGWGEGSHCSGFTLLELILAITILGLLLATVYGSLSRTTWSKEVAEERAELYANGRQAVLKMASDIEGALAPPYGDRFYFKGGSGSGQVPSLEFIAVNRGGFGVNRVRPGRVLVVYTLDELPKRRAGYALRREEHLWSKLLAEADGIELPEEETEEEDPAPTDQATYLLDCPDLSNDLNLPGTCNRVTGLRFRFYDDAYGTWRDEWDSTQTGAMEHRIPAAVEIALLLADADGQEHDFTTIVDLPIARTQPVTPGVGEDDGDDDGDDGAGGAGTGKGGAGGPSKKPDEDDE